MPDHARAEAAECRLELDGCQARLLLLGRWRLGQLRDIEAALAALQRPDLPLLVDASALDQIDSAAAMVLLRWLAAPSGTDQAAAAPADGVADGVAEAPADVPAITWVGLAAANGRIVDQVRGQWQAARPSAAQPRPGLLARIGWQVTSMGSLLLGHLNFFGGTLLALGHLLRHPARLRQRELVVQLEQTGLNAIPVVALVSSLIGVVVAYLLGLQAEQYGANVFVVDGVGIGATREFAPIIVAVVVAGRSGAAFTAQLGAMRLTEEIDAIRTLGLDAWQVLVLPRVLALMLALPLLVFVGDVAALLGAMAITHSMLDITPAGFIARLHEALPLRHVLIGLVKAPVFALVIAVIGTRMGMTVGRDTRAVGAATTSTVVQSIVAVILLDAGFAMLFQWLEL